LFTFWFFLSLFLLSYSSLYSQKKILLDFLEKKIFLFFLFGFFLFFSFFLFYFGKNNYLAEINYQRFLQESESNKRVSFLERTVLFNPYNPIFHLTLSQEYVNLLYAEIKQPEIKRERIGFLLDRVIKEEKKAIDISSANPFIWEGAGFILRNLQVFVDGALKEAQKSFQKALELNPKNPVLYVELGKLALNEEKIDEAKNYLEKGKGLNVFYWDLFLLEARIMDAEGKTKEAISFVQNLSSQFPFNTDILFELGRLYFNTNEIDLAIEQWKKVIELVPGHVNALYSLATAYQKKGDIATAISFLERVLAENSTLEKVRAELEELKKK
ncbi:MAG: tetratricopeptide repeat protein, partial [Minisyncoccales bacterium]